MSDPVCMWCGELVAEDEQHVNFANPMHFECGVRSVVGSVGHISGRCSCFVDDESAQEHDPLEMTKREAARAATRMFRGLTDRGAAWSPDKCSPNPLDFLVKRN